MFRKHQKDTLRACTDIIAGGSFRQIILNATPGSGKSAIPVIATKLIDAGLADALCWIVPRTALQDQGERNFIDPFFRLMVNHGHVIRSSTNETNPCRDFSGFVTTYQALSQDDKNTVVKEFKLRRYILVLDEFHHIEDGGIWHKALMPLMENAAYLVLMTGTLARGDEKKIAFIPYREVGSKLIPHITYSPDIRYIHYSRTDALAEQAILPLKFMLSDGMVRWQETSGFTRTMALSDTHPKASKALFSALDTEFADELLSEGLAHWIDYKRNHPRSKTLIVTANYKHAKRFSKFLKEKGISHDIATSHESIKAHKAIKKFKTPKLDVLVTIAMAYEGLDVPEITHIVSLTHIRSTPWIEQMIARAVRIDRQAGPYESQQGFIFAPDDVLFRKVVESIKAEQLALAKIPEEKGKRSGDGDGLSLPTAIPLSSRMTDRREFDFGVFNNIPMTVKESEEDILSKIETHIRAFANRNYYKPARLNGEIKRAFNGKPRREMTLRELKDVLQYVKRTYPLPEDNKIIQFEKKEDVSHPRGSGRRVPTKAVPWQTKLFI